MVDFIFRTAITAVALWVAVQLVPQITFDYGDDWWKLVAVAIVFGVINSVIKPFVKIAALPLRLMTFGLIGLVINAGLLLLLAAVSDRFDLGFQIGGFPPKLDLDAVVGAILAGIVITIVTTILNVFDSGRRMVT
ncbi:MAG: phage holin family protein [Chloroflexota bacterium]